MKSKIDFQSVSLDFQKTLDFVPTANADDSGGVWRTLQGGAKVFIKDGQVFAGGPDGERIGGGGSYKKGQEITIDGTVYIYEKYYEGFGDRSHSLRERDRPNFSGFFSDEVLLTGTRGDKEKSSAKEGDEITVQGFDKEYSYKMTKETAELLNSGKFKGSWDLLAVGQGNRRGAFTSASDFKYSDTGAVQANKLFKEFGVKATAYQGKKGIVVVSNDAKKESKEFVATAKKYLAGAVNLKDLSESEHRLLGSWLGYSRKDTDEYLGK